MALDIYRRKSINLTLKVIINRKLSMLSHIILKQQIISKKMSSGQKPGSFETEEQRIARLAK